MGAATNFSPSPAVTAVPGPVLAREAEFRSRMGSISRQSAVYFAGTIVTTAAGYFFRIYLARTLGAEALGLYALGMSIVGLLSLFNAFGLPAAAARFVAGYCGKREYARLGSFLRGSLALLGAGNLLLGAVLIVVGPWIAVHFYHAPALAAYFWPLALIMLFGVLNNFLGQVMAGYLDVSRRTLITHFIGTPANMLFAVGLISLGLGLAGYLTAQVISAFIILTLLAIYVFKMTPIDARHSGASMRIEKEVASFSVAAFAIASVEFVLSQADKIVLGYYLSATQVGIYAVAMALVGFVPVALQSVNQIFSPGIAELHATGNHSLLQRLYTTLTKWILALTIPLGLTIMIFARPLMGIFGSAFEAGAAVLIIGTVGQLVNCAVGSVGYLLLMSGHQNQMVKIQAVNAALMITLSILLVPKFGIRGAACAAAVSVAITNLWSLRAVHQRLKLLPYDSSYLKLLLPGILSGTVVVLLRFSLQAHSAFLVAALGLFCAYAVFLGAFVSFGLNGDDRRLAQAAWGKIGLNFRRNGAPIS
jgi:O-antigen/teichoic acid export membrane protein